MRSGFTLVELMVVVAIVGVMSAVAMFALGNAGNSSHASALARKLQFALARARTDAVSDGRWRRLSCTAARCQLQMAPTAATPDSTTVWITLDTIEAGKHAQLWALTSTTDLTTRSPTQMSGTLALDFHPDGSADAGTFYVEDTATNTAGHRYKVYVYQGTGMARLVSDW